MVCNQKDFIQTLVKYRDNPVIVTSMKPKILATYQISNLFL